MTVTVTPAPLRAAGVRVARDLDVRPMLARGEEPFEIIMSTTDGLRDDEGLHLVVPFEPRPLYDVMRVRGYGVHTTRDGEDFHVWFYRKAP